MTATIDHRLPVDEQTWLKCHIERTSEPVDVGAFGATLEVPAEAASPLLTNRHQDYRMTRRSILIGAVASLICAPVIVRAASLSNRIQVRPPFASKADPLQACECVRSDGAETGVAEPHIAEQSRSWRAVNGERWVMRGS